MKKLSKVICLVLSALMLLSLAACGKQGDGTGNTQGKPIEGGTFVYAIEEPITSLNWYNNSSTDLGKQVFQNLYDPMWKSNTDGSLDYRLAKSVDISEDGTTYTLTLRDDIFWSDGEKITTDDIVFTLDTLTVPEVAPSTATAYKVDGEFCTYEKQSDTVIVFKVGRASNLFKKALGALYILPAHCFEGVPATEVLTCEQNANIATSGAFVVDSFNVGEKLVCLKNPNYYRTAAHIDGFEVRCVSDASTQEIAFRNKELSIFTISNAETLANYKDNDEYQVVSYPDGRITFMEINPNSEAMSTMEARQAVIYALDLDALVYGTYGDEALCRTATSILSTVSMFYNPEITNYKQDLDKAAQLIEQTGLKDKTIKIIYNSARVGQEELATMIKSQLDAAGLNAQIDSMETAAYSLGLGCVILGSLLNNIPGLIDVLNLPEYTYPVLGLAIGKPDQNPTVKPRMPRTMQFFENTYPADADGVLDQLPAFDEEVHRYYDLRQADRPVDAFSDQVATISQQDVSHQTLLDKAAAQGFRLDQ
jgi:ABC-type transport system substrate-binding protein